MDPLEFTSGDFVVTTPSGGQVNLLSDHEVEYYNQIAARYQQDNIFSNVADIQELDRVLVMEVMVFRWSKWLLEEHDYFGEVVNVQELQKNINEYSKEIRLVKKALGIDKATREKEHGETVADYIHNLMLRAKKFGIMRNEQAVMAITLWQELVGKVTFYENCTEEERREFNGNAEDVIDWIKSQIPRFNEIDEKFRETDQQYWIRKI